MESKALDKVYPALAGAIVTFAAQYLVRAVWKVATGSQPPDPKDPHVPAREAVTWFVASSIGIGVAQLLAARYTRTKVETWRAEH